MLARIQVEVIESLRHKKQLKIGFRKMLGRIICLILLLTVALDLHSIEKEARRLLDSPYSGHQIELLLHPSARSEAPLLICFHGASSNKGANQFSEAWTQHWLNKGYTVSYISMPGYGKFTGNRDFCGPFTLRSLNFAIDALKAEMKSSSLVLVSFGQGALAAALLASQRSDIDCVVCANGGYDLFKHMESNDAIRKILISKDYDLDMDDEAALAARSPIRHLSKLSAPFYLIHRKGNPFVTEEEVRDFYSKMRDAGKECHLSLRDKTPELDVQKISTAEVLEEAEAWIDAVVKRRSI